MLLLDTDHLSILEWQDSPTAMQLRGRLRLIPPKELGTTIINFEESMRGWLAILNKARKLKDQIDAYHRLSRQVDLFKAIYLIAEFDEHAAIEFQRLRKEHPRLGAMDLKVAAIALTHRATLLSRNERDFGQIRGLLLENWI